MQARCSPLSARSTSPRCRVRRKRRLAESSPNGSQREQAASLLSPSSSISSLADLDRTPSAQGVGVPASDDRSRIARPLADELDPPLGEIENRRGLNADRKSVV